MSDLCSPKRARSFKSSQYFLMAVTDSLWSVSELTRNDKKLIIEFILTLTFSKCAVRDVWVTLTLH